MATSLARFHTQPISWSQRRTVSTDPEEAWRVFNRMRPAEMVATLRALAQKVRLKAYRKSPRGPKKPRPKGEGTSKSPHVSTAKLLRKRQVNAAAP